MKWIRDKYDQWCKETKRNGSVLVGGSVYDFFDWLESPSLSEGEPMPSQEWFIHEGIEFSTKMKTDSVSYKTGAGFGYSCGLQDGYKKFSKKSEGEEAIGFAEWVSEATGMTENHIYIDRNPFGIGGGYYTIPELYKLYKSKK